ncbi:MAG: XRE family transcriptional regulator [Sphingobium sp.]|nr:XRE family transcriptional regulator [Sphingobium sp.]
MLIPSRKCWRIMDKAITDLRAYDRAKVALETGDDELLPAEYVGRIIAGENPLRVWRDVRGMTQMALADASGVNRVQIANIESGIKAGSVATVKKLAEALNITVDELI